MKKNPTPSMARKLSQEMPRPDPRHPSRQSRTRGQAVTRSVDGPAVRESDLQRHSLLSFFELSKELDYSLNIYDFADRALFNFMGHLGTPHSALWILPPEATGSLVLIRSHGIPEPVARQIGTQCIETLVDRLLRDRRIQFRDDLSDIFTPSDLELLRSRGLALFAPLLAPDKLLGVVALGTRQNSAADPFEIEVLQASAEFFAVALQNSMFYHQLQESVRELRQANENLQELDRAKNEFVSNMHHELRTPVTVMQMYAESLLEEAAAGSSQREHLKIVLQQTEKLKRMLENLLDYSGLAGNRIEVQCGPGDISALLRDYYDNRRNGVAARLHDFRLVLEDDLPAVIFEPRRMRQVLDILLDNAMRFTPQGARITLRAHRMPDDPAMVRIQMEDNGPGIAADKLHKLFVPFLQVDGSLTREKNGLGLGLALAHRLVQAMGGKILAASEIDRGTTFSLLLPIA